MIKQQAALQMSSVQTTIKPTPILAGVEKALGFSCLPQTANPIFVHVFYLSYAPCTMQSICFQLNSVLYCVLQRTSLDFFVFTALAPEVFYTSDLHEQQ